MIEELKTSIVGVMQNDSNLTALLAKIPNTSLSAIFSASRNRTDPVYPCITYRIETSAPDKRFSEPFPLSPGASKTAAQIESYFLDLEAWDNQPSGETLYLIAAELDLLFHQTRFTAGAGAVFKSERITSKPDLYDDTANIWYGLFRYRIRLKF